MAIEVGLSLLLRAYRLPSMHESTFALTTDYFARTRIVVSPYQTKRTLYQRVNQDHVRTYGRKAELARLSATHQKSRFRAHSGVIS